MTGQASAPTADLAEEKRRWIRPLAENPDATRRLVVFPHAGGSANYFCGLAAELGPTWDVQGVLYPARQDRHRETAPTSIQEIAEKVTDLLPESGDGTNTFFFGHSMGALIAFEVIRHQSATGVRPPDGLFVSSRPSMSGPWRSLLDTSEVALKSDIRLFHGTMPAELSDPDVFAQVMKVMRYDYDLLNRYRRPVGTVRIPCPIAAFHGDDDPGCTVQDQRRWADSTEHQLTLRTFDGGHFYLDANLHQVGRAISQCAAEMATA